MKLPLFAIIAPLTLAATTLFNPLHAKEPQQESRTAKTVPASSISKKGPPYTTAELDGAFSFRMGTIATTSVGVYLARTAQEQARGLMHIKTLAPNSVMLFEFPGSTAGCFWMRNTFVPLDIGFFNKERKLLAVRSMKALDETPVCPPPGSMYAIEANSDFYRTNLITVGHQFTLAP